MVTSQDTQLTPYFSNCSKKRKKKKIKHIPNIGSRHYFGGPKNLSIEVNTQGIEIIEINLLETGYRMIIVYDKIAMVT